MRQYTVLMSVYIKERPNFLLEALSSIYHQSLLPSEVVLVEDGPLNSDLNQIIALFPQLKIVKLTENRGLSNALNVGLQFCSNELVARMDTDDICDFDRFEKQVSFLQSHPDIDIVGSYATKIDEKGESLHEVMKVPTQPDAISQLVWTCPMNHPTVMFKKSKILSVGGYNSKAGPRQDDFDLWFRCAEKGLRFANIPESLLYYRFFSDNLKKNSVKVAWYRIKVGFRGCHKLHYPIKAYLGVCVPFVRALLPYPINVYFQRLMNRFNPRSK